LASLGDVACVVIRKNGEAVVPLKAHAFKDPDAEDDEDSDDDDANAQVPEPPIRWTRSFGNMDYKKPGSNPRLTATPDVSVVNLDNQYRGVALVCRQLYNAIGRSMAVSTVFKRSGGRPRMASGALVDAAVQWLGQLSGDVGLGSVVAFLEGMEPVTEPQQKRRKTDQPSQVRLRHILLKHRECKSTTDKVRNKQVKRSRGEAERLLRAVLEECEIDPKKSATAFTTRCRELSECPTSLTAGELSGDLGWVKPGKNEAKFGPSFDAIAFALQVGQLSDLIDSDQGVHILIRAA
jgi:NIMA-interacting peptidyl-prolyl cis-trans isomerase 1